MQTLHKPCYGLLLGVPVRSQSDVAAQLAEQLPAGSVRNNATRRLHDDVWIASAAGCPFVRLAGDWRITILDGTVYFLWRPDEGVDEQDLSAFARVPRSVYAKLPWPREGDKLTALRSVLPRELLTLVYPR